MEVQKGEWIRAAMRIVEDFFSNRDMEKSYYYESRMECITPYAKGEGNATDGFRKHSSGHVGRVLHREYRIVMRTGRAAVITGSCHVALAGASGKEREDFINVTLVLLAGEGERIRLRLIHISHGSDMGRRYCLRDIKERIFYMEEQDILYLEAMHNHVIWHCRETEIVTVDTLKEKERTLSDAFVRVQRGYIVNIGHICRIDRCCVEMDNGDVIRIPVKKFCAIRDELLERRAGKEVRDMRVEK